MTLGHCQCLEEILSEAVGRKRGFRGSSSSNGGACQSASAGEQTATATVFSLPLVKVGTLSIIQFNLQRNLVICRTFVMSPYYMMYVLPIQKCNVVRRSRRSAMWISSEQMALVRLSESGKSVQPDCQKQKQEKTYSSQEEPTVLCFLRI